MKRPQNRVVLKGNAELVSALLTNLIFSRLMPAFILGVSLLALSACGGSSDASNTAPNRPALAPGPVPPSTGSLTPLIDATNIQVFGDSEATALSAVGFAIIPKANNQIESVTWTQTAGPSVIILAANSQTIGFDVQSIGSYSFTAQVQFANGIATESHAVNLSVNAMDRAKAAVRLDHTVSELGKVSLHVGGPDNKEINNVVWTQTSGPTVQNSNADEAFLFFDAPSVNNDELISYNAQITYTDGTTATDDVYLTVKNINFDETGLFFANNIIISQDMHTYRASSSYKQALERCVYNNNIPRTPNCNLNTLPLIGTVSTNPSIDDILDRTLVSHQWMGQRFAEFLTTSRAGPDMLAMLRGVTAIVISYDVRPSFYWAATGAIYLDPNSFWRTAQERDTLNDVPDFRSDFGSDLQFSFFWRYVKDNQYYPATRYSKQNREQRAFADIEANLSWLMYHELAHANDFFPPTVWATINQSQTPLAYFNSNGTNSDIINDRFPLRSDQLHELAQVRFRNVEANDTQKSYRGSDIERFFSPDIAPSFYAYLTEREDFATLVERFMMLYRLGADADIAIIDGATDDDFTVSWGQRNRISAESLRHRTVFAVQHVYPELGNVSTLIETLPSPIQMDNTLGWFGNLNLSDLTRPSANSNSHIIAQQFLDSLTKAERKRIAQQDAREVHHGKPIIPLQD